MVGCLLEIDTAKQTASMGFTLNGGHMGVAFPEVKLASPTDAMDGVLKVGDGGGVVRQE